MQTLLIRASVLYSRARALAPLVVVLIAAAAIWPTWPPLLETWRVMPDYSYGELLVPFILGWLAVRSVELPPPGPRTEPLAVLALTACLVSWLIAYGASSAIGQQLMVPVILWCAIWTAFGIAVARRLAVPLACLYFAIPVWEFLVPILQSAAVWVVHSVFGVLGIPVHIDGSVVSIPEGTFKIAEACAGRRYFVVCITVAALFAGTMRMRPLRAAAFLLISAALAVVFNWIRVLTVIYAGHVTHMTSYLVAKEHISFGWALFAVLMIVVCLIGARFTRSNDTLPPAELGSTRNSAFGLRQLLLRPALPVTVSILLIPIVAVAYARHDANAFSGISRRAAISTLPRTLGAWNGPRTPDDAWLPRYESASVTARGSYEGSSGHVEAFAAEYAREQRGAKLISSANLLFPATWMVLHRSTLSGAAGKALRVNPRLLQVETPAGEHWEISYLYSIDDFVTRNAITAQLAYGVLSWVGPTHSRIAAVATRCRSSCAAASRRLASFWSAEGNRLLEFASGDAR